MLLQDYRDFLKNCGRSENTVKIYTRKLQIFLDNGFSEADLIGAVDQLIMQYSKGGDRYDPKDHGYTVAALKQLKDFLRAPYAENLLIAYEQGFHSFVPKNRYVSGYTIADGTITISYQKGFTPLKSVTKTIPKQYYGTLIDLIMRYEKLLSPSNTAIRTHHGNINTYRYEIHGRRESDCGSLFASEKQQTVAEQANQAYRNWLSRYIP